MAFLELQGLSKRFGTFTAVEALSLAVEQGEFVSLLGPSGCGKTTTLQMIAGLHPPSAGRVWLAGEDITAKPPERRGLGVVFQSYALFPHMTVAGNVSFGLEMRGVARGERRERVATALAQVRLAELAGRYPRELSGGQRQRVALARALVIGPPLLLLDEPLSNLDAKLREDMQLELRLLQQELGVTTILVTHDQSEALSMSDRVVVMNRGRVVQTDTPVGMYGAPANAFVSGFVGKTNLFAGRVAADNHQPGRLTVVAGGVRFNVSINPAQTVSPGSEAFVALRPEQLTLSEPGAGVAGAVDGTVRAAIFHGDRWLYQVHSALGEVIVTEPNRGAEPHRRGQPVGLSWRPDAPRLLLPGDDG